MFGAGLPLNRCLELLALQSESAELRQASSETLRRIESGQSLSRAMASSPLAFPVLQRRMVEVGEGTGALQHVFLRLALHEEGRLVLQRRLGGALQTPALVAAFCFGLAVFLPPYLFQGLFEMLRDSGLDLPWPTRVLLMFSDLVRSPLGWVALVLLSFLGYLGWQTLAGQPRWRLLWGEACLKLPLLGRVFRLAAVSRFSQCLESLLGVGVPILPALELSARASSSPVLEARIPLAVAALREGERLRAALERLDFFPTAFAQGMETGQESGRTTAMLASLRQLYDIELEHSLMVMGRALEPLFLLGVGGLVGFTVLAIVWPMIQLVNQI